MNTFTEKGAQNVIEMMEDNKTDGYHRKENRITKQQQYLLALHVHDYSCVKHGIDCVNLPFNMNT